jgi:hypothetical protein
MAQDNVLLYLETHPRIRIFGTRYSVSFRRHHLYTLMKFNIAPLPHVRLKAEYAKGRHIVFTILKIYENNGIAADCIL